MEPKLAPNMATLMRILDQWGYLQTRARELGASLTCNDDMGWYLEGPINEHEDCDWALCGDGEDWEATTPAPEPELREKIAKLGNDIGSFFAASGAYITVTA